MPLYDLKNRTTKFGDARSWIGKDKKRYSDTHKGDDYAQTYGHDHVPAIQPGLVLLNGYSSTFGWRLWVKRDGHVVVKYHMLNEASGLPVGAAVQVGMLVGRTGASAENATGNHVHIQVEYDGKPVDPRPYIAPSIVAAPPKAVVQLRRKPTMFIVWDTSGGGYLVTDKGRAHIPNMQVWRLFERLLKSTPEKPETFNAAEHDMMLAVIRNVK